MTCNGLVSDLDDAKSEKAFKKGKARSVKKQMVKNILIRIIKNDETLKVLQADLAGFGCAPKGPAGLEYGTVVGLI